MKDIYNVPQNELIEKTALELKKIPSIKPPAWAEFVKTGTHKERPPSRDDWWYVRAAAILRTTHKIGPIGVSKLRAKYGGKKNRGVKPEKFYSGSGKIIRTILQQLEEAELVKKAEKGVHKGRIIAPKGISILDKTAAKISGKKPQAMPKKPAEAKEKKSAEAEKKPKDIKEKPKEEKSVAQKTEKAEKKPELKKQDIKTEQLQEIKKPAEEKPAEAKAEEKKEEPEKEDKPEAGKPEDKAEAKKGDKVPTAAELAKKSKK